MFFSGGGDIGSLENSYANEWQRSFNLIQNAFYDMHEYVIAKGYTRMNWRKISDNFYDNGIQYVKDNGLVMTQEQYNTFWDRTFANWADVVTTEANRRGLGFQQVDNGIHQMTPLRMSRESISVSAPPTFQSVLQAGHASGKWSGSYCRSLYYVLDFANAGRAMRALESESGGNYAQRLNQEINELDQCAWLIATAISNSVQDLIDAHGWLDNHFGTGFSRAYADGLITLHNGNTGDKAYQK